MSKVVCASDYGGPSDPTSGVTGYHGDNLNGKMAFAELRMGTALGNLPYRAKVVISYNGRSVTAEKLDIGLGGPGCGGHSREIDLWYQTAKELGFSGLAPVTVTLPGESGIAQNTENASFLPFGLGGVPGENIPEELAEGKIPNPIAPLEEGVNNVKGLVGILGNIPADFHKIYELLFTPQGWVRIGKILLGTFLLLSGVLGMANVSADPVIQTGKKGAELAVAAAAE